MSRTTRRGEKGPGYEYWSRRRGNHQGGGPGKQTKVTTHRLERRVEKPEEISRELASWDLDPASTQGGAS